jgi:hypothetical protein
MCVTTDTDQLWQYRSTAWVAVDSRTASDGRYVNIDGDTMSGNLVVQGAGAPNTAIGTDGRIAALCNSVNLANVALDRVLSTAAAIGQPFINFLRISTIVGSIQIASGTSISYNTTSDRRLKTATGDVADAAAIVQALGARAYRGRWIADGDTGEEWVFVNSQDVEPVAPWAVHGAGDATATQDDVDAGRAGAVGDIIPQQLDHGALVPLLIAALAQALERIDALEATP